MQFLISVLLGWLSNTASYIHRVIKVSRRDLTSLDVDIQYSANIHLIGDTRKYISATQPPKYRLKVLPYQGLVNVYKSEQEALEIADRFIRCDAGGIRTKRGFVDASNLVEKITQKG